MESALRFLEHITVFGLSTLVAVGCIKTDRERAVSAGAVPVTRQDAEAQFVGNTVVGTIPQYSLNFVVYYEPDGRLSGEINGPVSDSARGTWRINDDGKVCNEWSKATWRTGPPCNQYFRQGLEYKVFTPEGVVASISKVEEGNSHNLELRTDFEVANVGGALKKLPAEYLREKVQGNTLSGRLPGLGNARYHAFYTDEGSVSATIPTAHENDRGAYRVTDDGKMCVTWKRWQDGKEQCGHWYLDGEEIKVFDESGNLGITAKVRSGNPEKLKI